MLVEELETGNTLLRKQGDEIFSLQALAEASPAKPVRSEVLPLHTVHAQSKPQTPHP